MPPKPSPGPGATSKLVHGELQAQLMPVLWRIGEGTVEQVRAALPERYRSAYNTVQTVLNRLARRGLLDRERRGHSIVYRPTITEADYVASSIASALAAASSDARELALAGLVGRMDGDELARLAASAQDAG